MKKRTKETLKIVKSPNWNVNVIVGTLAVNAFADSKITKLECK